MASFSSIENAYNNAKANAEAQQNPAAGGVESRGSQWDQQAGYGLIANERERQGMDVPTSFGGEGLAQAYGTGTQDYNRMLGQGMGALQSGYGGAQDMYNPYMQQAQNATGMQAAMSGAMGPEAQAQAMQNIQASPGQDFIRDRMKKSLMAQQKLGGDFGTGNPNEMGGMSGRTAQALQEQAGGWAMQDIDNQFNRLGQVAQPGLAMTNQLGGMRYGLGQGQAGIYGQQGQNMMQGQLGAAGARQQEIKDIYGANLMESQSQDQWDLAQQQAEFQNISNVIEKRKIAAGLKAASDANKTARVGAVSSGIGAAAGAA
jgi:hypothetical protein